MASVSSSFPLNTPKPSLAWADHAVTKPPLHLHLPPSPTTSLPPCRVLFWPEPQVVEAQQFGKDAIDVIFAEAQNMEKIKPGEVPAVLCVRVVIE